MSINVDDIVESRRFYCDVLGLQAIARPDFDFAGEWLAAGEQQIHLIEVAGFAPPMGQHFALEVDDLDASIDDLVSRDVAVSAAAEIAGVCRQAFFTDPTGNLIELTQPLP